MQTAEITMHDVTGIKLISTYIANGNSRTIIIETKRGSIEILMFGDTDDADKLPRHSDFHDYTISA